jgi:hypothetical protein
MIDNCSGLRYLVIFKPCFTMAGVSAFSINNGRRPVIDVGVELIGYFLHEMLPKQLGN